MVLLQSVEQTSPCDVSDSRSRLRNRRCSRFIEHSSLCLHDLLRVHSTQSHTSHFAEPSLNSLNTDALLVEIIGALYLEAASRT